MTKLTLPFLTLLLTSGSYAYAEPKELNQYLESTKKDNLQYGALLQNYSDHFSKKCRRYITVKELQSSEVNKLITATFSSQGYGNETVKIVNSIVTENFNCIDLNKPFQALQNNQKLHEISPKYAKFLNMMGDIELNGNSDSN
ncbi:hypothetical protein ACTFQF_00380 [Aliivibrio fischeri]|uniref:Uncharacterized protein n=1 Tax=Aliivibrio fischeri (strain MJ11) TaxID=388396 RepID=B5EVY3_ALIFM|nr:hypothetical protein [Aliivibrio fischeri]ACH64674.1 hypothetical protein VFMJ11_B0040 [Aliivibrio fischeri MJ11]MUK37512.1 hypothetical protein [Aliivibrio fischeri]